MPFEVPSDDQITRRGKALQVEHSQAPFLASESAETKDLAGDTSSARAVADAYLRTVAPVFGLSGGALPGAAADEIESDTKMVSGTEREMMGTTTVSYQQAYRGLPVWEAGVSVTVQQQPLRVTASHSTVQPEVILPENQTPDNMPFRPGTITPEILKAQLGIESLPVITTANQQYVYAYEAARRRDLEATGKPQEGLEGGPPTLPLPAVPAAIKDEQWRIVTEVFFKLPDAPLANINWRALVDGDTACVLFLRALTSCISGMVFPTDPFTAGGPATATPNATASVLNGFRRQTSLRGLNGGNPLALHGEFVRIVNLETPHVVPPTTANPPGEFHFDAPTREFAAVNAYHHCDACFRLMEDLGFDVASFFDGTTFPVPVDACAHGDELNASAPGNAVGQGSDGFRFGLAGTPFPAVGRAANVRTVLHEFGHVLLWDSVHSPNFGFAHSAGDCLAAILQDPDSALRPDPNLRFRTFPWGSNLRRHDQVVASGWAWHGINDVGSYESEQILSTTLFRLYRSLGGDSDDAAQRRQAARQAVYLIIRSIGSLATVPVTPTPMPENFATALMNADIGTLNFEGYLGGAFHKVIRWSFEKQGMYQPPAAPVPVSQPGASPPVDVYVDDGRGGEYGFRSNAGETTEIWNRRAPSGDGGNGVHETPIPGVTNHLYVRVRNRGRAAAQNARVRVFLADPTAGLQWPADWTPTVPAELTIPGGVAAGAARIAGPFAWTPLAANTRALLAEVSADGDFSNLDARTFFPCASGPVAVMDLIPFDNNLSFRTMVI